ncbi:MAG: acyl-CoA dehydrogenase family protein [Elusimicrobia bacterium]|nr:acyl-CoA dehydrogenase family protein [Elusimicrobiota bacterium]
MSAILTERLPGPRRAAALAALTAFGAACGGELGRLIEEAHQDGKYPRLQKYDRWGRRVDRVVYNEEQLQARRLAFRHGLLPPKPLLERMTMAYLLAQNGEGGVGCPLAMTDGLAAVIEEYGTAEQKALYLPIVRDADGPTPFTGGQFVTEQQGGSDVSAGETRAVLAVDGTWRLTGLKWFCSNPGELWVTTAKPEGSNAVGLFLVPRRLNDGSLNECHILRLKDLSGTRGKATAEVEYRGAYAELIGRASRGIAILLNTVISASRLHVAAGALGFMRRSFVEASLYARARRVAGRPAAELPPIAAALERMEAELAAGTLAYFEGIACIERGDPAAEVLLPLLKMELSRGASRMIHEARLILAGNATLRDFSILPRLAEDAIAQEIWEGTHLVLAGHALKALRRPASGAAIYAILSKHECQDGRRLARRLEKLRSAPASERPEDVLEICAATWRALRVALLSREASGPLDVDGSFTRLAAVLAAPVR